MSDNLSNKKIKNTYQKVVQVHPSPSGSITPELYDLLGNRITGIKMQEAFERDVDGNLQPTIGAFHDTFWEEDSSGNKMPRDIKWWLDSDFNLIMVPNNE